MNLEDKTKEQLIDELTKLRRKVADLESRLPHLTHGKDFLGDAQGQLLGEPLEDLTKLPELKKMFQQEVDHRTRLESQLAQSESLYRKLVETAKDVIWTVDLDLNYTYVSPSVTKVLGYTVEEIMSMNPLSTMTPLSRDRIVGAFQEELALEASGPRDKYASRSEEIEQHHKDGYTRWQEITTTFLRANDGSPIGILGISHDITERKQMEEELRQARDELEKTVQERTTDLTTLNETLLLEIDERRRAEEELRGSEQRLELALKGANLGLWDLYPQTGQGFVNRRSAEIVGYSLDEIQPSFGFWESLLHPDDRVRAAETLLAHLEGRTDYYEDVYRVKTKSGEWKWIFSGGKAVERDPDGKPLRMSGIYLDITDRKITEEALRESEKRYRELVEKANDIIYRTNANGFFILFNPVGLRITGYSKEEIGHKHYLDLIHPDFKNEVERLYGLQFVKRIPDTYYEVPIISRQGETVWIGQNVQLVMEGDKVVGFQAICRDITDRKKAEEKLRESEERFRQVFEQGPLGMAILDLDYHWLTVNATLCKMVGYTEDELTKLTVVDITHPDDIEVDLDQHDKVLQGKIPVKKMDKRYIKKGGEVLWTRLTGSLVREEQGNAVYFLAMIEDITERKQAEEKLEKEKKFSDTTIDSLPGIFYLFDDTGRFRRWNKNFERVSGYSNQEISGMHPLEFFSDEEKGIVRKTIDDVFAKGEGGIEADFVSKGGSKTPYYFTGRRMILDGKECLAGMGVDMAKRKEAEEALRRSEQQLNLALEGADLGLWDWNLKTGRAIWDERAIEMLGYVRDEVELNLGFWKGLVHPEDWPKVSEALNGHMEGRLPSYEAEHRLLSKSGDWKWVLARGKIVGHDTDGKPLRMVGTSLDITQRKSAEREMEHLRDELLQAQKMEAIGTLAGGIAHDFNNLLQVTLGYSELLLQERKEDDPEYADLMKIFQSAKNGAELVQRILTFGRKVEPKPIPLSLNRQIVQVEKLLRRTIPKMIDIEMDLSSDLAEIHADPTQMEQVLLNLGVNARDAMPDGGKLTVGTKNVTLDEEWCRVHVGVKAGEYILLTVSDTGHGMDKATIDHIFEPFYTTKELGRGTGLGLAMVYGIVEQHNGYITCESETGHGTSFNIYFPAIESQAEPEVDKTSVMPAFGTETILLVDDEEFVRDLGARILSKAGYNVLTATNGREALDLFEKEATQISLVILDLIMPEMGGKECLRELRRIDPQMKVLIASGLSADPSMRESPELGAKGFVSKPFRMKELLRQVRKVLDES